MFSYLTSVPWNTLLEGKVEVRDSSSAQYYIDWQSDDLSEDAVCLGTMVLCRHNGSVEAGSTRQGYFINLWGAGALKSPNGIVNLKRCTNEYCMCTLHNIYA